MASITKLMTALVAVQRLELDRDRDRARGRDADRRVDALPAAGPAHDRARPRDRHARAERERRRDGARDRSRRERPALRRGDEHGGAAAGPHRHALSQPARARPGRLTSRPRGTARYYSAMRSAWRRPASLRGRSGGPALERPLGALDRQPRRHVPRLRRRQDRATRRSPAGRRSASRSSAASASPSPSSARRPRRSATATSQRSSASGSGATGHRASWIPPARTPASRSAGADRRFDSWRHARSCGRRPSGRPLTEHDRRPRRASRSPSPRASALGTLVVRDGGRVVARSPLVAADARD